MRINFRKTTVNRLYEELKTAHCLNNFRLFKITKAILMIADGEAMSSIAVFFSVSTKTIYNWLCRFLTEGFSWLVGHHYRGRGRHQG
jgi:transposase